MCDSAFEQITLESERIRLFREFLQVLEVRQRSGPPYWTPKASSVETSVTSHSTLGLSFPCTTKEREVLGCPLGRPKALA